jgi:hypothetical protein
VSKEPTKVFFITWPDGKVMEGTQTSVRDSMAIGKAIATFLPAQWFPGVNLDAYHFGPAGELWRAMQKAGFKCQFVEVPADGVSY